MKVNPSLGHFLNPFKQSNNMIFRQGERIVTEALKMVEQLYNWAHEGSFAYHCCVATQWLGFNIVMFIIQYHTYQ
jgi:hypothetical protein